MSEGPETQLLLTAGRLLLGTARDEEALALVRLPLDWPRLFEKATREGMRGVLAVQLRRLAQTYGVDLPHHPVTQVLHGIFKHNGTLLARLFALCPALRRQGLQVILLKGGALLETVYRSRPGVRPLSDLDLLVRAPDLPRLKEVLLTHGFQPFPGSASVFYHGAVVFDLHTDLIGAARVRRKALAFHFDGETLWREASPLDPQDPTLLVLSPAHQLLHLAVHALQHSFPQLVWFIDLGLVLEHVRWGEVLNQAEAAGVLRALAYALFALRALMGVQFPPEVAERLPRLQRLERLFVRQVVRRRQMYILGEMAFAFSIPGLRGKLSYLRELGFPQREVLAEARPATPSWLLYPQRLLHLIVQGWQEGKGILRS